MVRQFRTITDNTDVVDVKHTDTYNQLGTPITPIRKQMTYDDMIMRGICPDCGNDLVFTGGCKTCMTCGFDICGL